MFDAYINGLLKGGNPQKAVEIFQRMKRDQCQPSTETYTMLINLYGKVSLAAFSPRLCELQVLMLFYDLMLVKFHSVT